MAHGMLDMCVPDLLVSSVTVGADGALLICLSAIGLHVFLLSSQLLHHQTCGDGVSFQNKVTQEVVLA